VRRGILGGAFNPPHIGHLICAQEAQLRLSLERVAFVPVGQAPHRGIEGDPGAESRLEMCRRAVGGDDRLDVLRLELDREGPSYTVDTLRDLRERDPEDELVLVLGGDQAATLPTWHAPEEVLRLAEVAVVPRTGFSREAVAVKIARLRGAQHIRFFDMPRIGVSSTMVRRRVARGEPIRYLLPAPVADYIVEQGLYRAAVPAGAEG
jgi:nicotinate-nucleotide adenylyltransferase